jgi:hypothetical protein
VCPWCRTVADLVNDEADTIADQLTRVDQDEPAEIPGQYGHIE